MGDESTEYIDIIVGLVFVLLIRKDNSPSYLSDMIGHISSISLEKHLFIRDK